MPAELVAESPRDAADLERLDLGACLPLLAVHLGCLLVLVTGVSPTALAVCAGFYLLRAFGLTAGYHRYFSHRSYRTSRPFQFVLAFLGASAAQLGPLWWPAHHRQHHRHSDTALDPHPPGVRGLWWAHMGWLLRRRHSVAPLALVPDLVRVPELRLLERFHWIAPLSLAAVLFAAGQLLAVRAPQLGTSGLQLLAWGFFVSTTLLYHVTFAVNSLGHTFGRRDFETGDASRNSLWLALITLGDGWHNNHHHHPVSARHGFRPSQLDPTWLALRGLERLGLVWDLREPPAELRRPAAQPAALPARRLRRSAPSTSAAATLAPHEPAKRWPHRSPLPSEASPSPLET